jgi:hypothetical protein
LNTPRESANLEKTDHQRQAASSQSGFRRYAHGNQKLGFAFVPNQPSTISHQPSPITPDTTLLEIQCQISDFLPSLLHPRRLAVKWISIPAIFLIAMTMNAQQKPLLFIAPDTTTALGGYTPLRLFPLPPSITWPGAGASGRGVFAIHAWAVPKTGPTADRANEAVLIGWNPMGRLQPDQPGYWWQYEWSYGQTGTPLFELNLDVRDSAMLGARPGLRRISYKINRKTGAGISADFAFQNVSFVEGATSAGDKLPENYLQINTRSNRFRANLRADFRKIVQQVVLTTTTADGKLFLPCERGNIFSSRLIPLDGAVTDSTEVTLNAMESGARYTLKIRNEREYDVQLTWKATHGRRLFWDIQRPLPTKVESGTTIIVEIVVDENHDACGRIYGIFRISDR